MQNIINYINKLVWNYSGNFILDEVMDLSLYLCKRLVFEKTKWTTKLTNYLLKDVPNTDLIWQKIYPLDK